MKAYPYMHKHPTSGQTEIAEGMDLRDWFAGLTMQAILTAKYPITKEPYAENEIAKAAYQGADAMMKQRKEVPNE